MRNPGLEAFALYVHPRLEHITDPADPDFDPDERGSDWTPPEGFSERLRNPGQSIRVPPGEVGPSFKPGQSPEDVIQGEVVTPAEQDGADKIIRGEHTLNRPSDNPFVEHARQDLHTPASSVAVDTVSALVSGAHPSSVPQDALQAAHDYLGQHFSDFQVNPHHGTVMAYSSAGAQVMRRHVNLPAVSNKPAVPTFSLTNKHGTFESHDAHRLVESMVAFQIMSNEAAQQARAKKKKDKDKPKAQNGLSLTSGLFGHGRPSPRAPLHAPDSAVFEEGNNYGTDIGPHGQPGHYVAPIADAPDHWLHDYGAGVSYSPGSWMKDKLLHERAVQPYPDSDNPGHDYTYEPNDSTGHVIPRVQGGQVYYVRSVHPDARYNRNAPPASMFRIPRAPAPASAPVSPHPVSSPPVALPTSAPPSFSHIPEEEPVQDSMDDKTASATTNDLCPVCASGYLEPYDGIHHECLNCGSLVKEATRIPKSRQRGGLGRGLSQIQPYTGDPLNLASGGSEDPENTDAEQEPGVHPLAGEVNENLDEAYQAPKRILDKKAADGDGLTLDEHMGKLGLTPLHRSGDNFRAYYGKIPDRSGATVHARVTEGAPKANGDSRVWSLSVDHVPPAVPWQQNGENYGLDKLPIMPQNSDAQPLWQRLPDPHDRALGKSTVVATGSHPVDDPRLNGAIRDLMAEGRGSATYRRMKALDNAYEAPRPQAGPGTQQARRMWSSVQNPGLAVFALTTTGV